MLRFEREGAAPVTSLLVAASAPLPAAAARLALVRREGAQPGALRGGWRTVRARLEWRVGGASGEPDGTELSSAGRFPFAVRERVSGPGVLASLAVAAFPGAEEGPACACEPVDGRLGAIFAGVDEEWRRDNDLPRVSMS